MMKLSKKFLIVSLTCFSFIFAIALIIFSNSKSVNVVAAEESEADASAIQDAIGTCGHSGLYAVDGDGNQILDKNDNPIDNSTYLLKTGYFKFALKEVSEGTSAYNKYCSGYDGWNCMAITVSKGKFAINGDVTVMDYDGVYRNIPNFFTYYVANGGNVLDNKHPIIVRFNSSNETFKNIDDNVLINFNFVLAENVTNGDGFGCATWDKVSELKSHEGDPNFSSLASGVPQTSKEIDGSKYYSFGTEVQIDVSPENEAEKVENPYYYTYCADIRDGTNNYFKSDTFVKYYDASLKDKYYDYIGDACDQYVNGVLKEAELKDHLEQMVVTTWVNEYASDSSKYPIDEEFNDYKDKFAEYKDLAIKSGHSYDGDAVSGETFELKCNANPVSASEFNSKFNDRILDPKTKLPSYNISANKEYYYAIKTTEKAINFEQTFTSGQHGTLELGTCKQTCEEVVVVEYGPPIASTGGLCFEYQVQVTSKIECKTTNTLKPLPKLELCTPTPYCNNDSNFYSQAGPNEAFEKCINSCDGGRYTEKCSESCYEKVYEGTNLGKLQKNSYNFDEVIASRLGVNSPLSFEGSYKWDGNKIKWDNPNTYGRFYSTGKQYSCLKYGTWNGNWCSIGQHGNSPYGKYPGYYWPVSGFKWHYTYGGVACSNYCSWGGRCTKKSYLNPKELNDDEAKLRKEYDSAAQICAAKASCTEKTAKFKISINYSYYTNAELEKAKKDYSYKPEATDTTIEFPFSTGSESLTSSATENKCTGTASDLSYNPKHTILKYAGCYKNCGDDTLYHTRWSFPGGWENDKSGELSWDDKSGKSGWKVLPDKFCLPSTIKNTNEKFWWYYFSNLPEDQIPSWAEFIKSKYKPDLSYTEDDASKINYNIKASASNFGYFGWNFNFACFYASYNQGVNPETTFKTVDLVDLFPNYGSGKAPDAFNTDEKQLPFNWSPRAVQNNGEKPELASNPTIYGKYVQKNGNNIYNDDELEYHFHLTPSTMRAFNRSDFKVYSESDTVNKHGILAYVSKVIREGALKDATVRAPSTGVLGCLNIKNVKDGMTTGTCQTLTDLSK